MLDTSVQGDCHWARWLLLSRIKGCEYDASFFNARAIMSHNLVSGNNLSALEINDIICTVDDIAEGGWELAALATLMYAPAPIQNCLSSGGVNRHSTSAAQCSLENLRPALQQFPTLWRTLVAACFGQDTVCTFVGLKVKNGQLFPLIFFMFFGFNLYNIVNFFHFIWQFSFIRLPKLA